METQKRSQYKRKQQNLNTVRHPHQAAMISIKVLAAAACLLGLAAVTNAQEGDSFFDVAYDAEDFRDNLSKDVVVRTNSKNANKLVRKF